MNEILQGIRVLDFTHVASGPMCTMLLGDPGATCDNVVTSPQAQHDQAFISVNHPYYGEIKMPAFGLKFSQTPAQVKLPPPSHGEHTEEILLSFGYDKNAIKSLFETKVVF